MNRNFSAAKKSPSAVAMGLSPRSNGGETQTAQVTGRAGATLLSVVLEYSLAIGMFGVASLINLLLRSWIGYQTIALIYLLAVVLLALFVNRGPIVVGTLLTAVGWRFLFAPPRYSLSISDSYDQMMFATYFAVALTVGELTARLRAKHDAELQARLLAESERLSRSLLNSVSHELRTPIAAITSAAQSLQTTESLTSAQKNLASEIEAASARLNRVVQSLLSAARLQSGQVRPKLDWCDLSDLVQVTVRDLQEMLEGRKIETRISAELPLANADFVLTQQSLSNLLLNVAMHTPPSTPVEISVRAGSSHFALEVADRGPGLSADQLDRVFDAFHRAPNSKTGGTGLGLAIVKGFVEAQGGRVTGANRESGGAIFTILLPR